MYLCSLCSFDAPREDSVPRLRADKVFLSRTPVVRMNHADRRRGCSIPIGTPQTTAPGAQGYSRSAPRDCYPWASGFSFPPYYLLPTTYYLLPTTYYLLPTTFFSPHQVRPLWSKYAAEFLEGLDFDLADSLLGDAHVAPELVERDRLAALVQAVMLDKYGPFPRL